MGAISERELPSDPGGLLTRRESLGPPAFRIRDAYHWCVDNGVDPATMSEAELTEMFPLAGRTVGASDSTPLPSAASEGGGSDA